MKIKLIRSFAFICLLVAVGTSNLNILLLLAGTSVILFVISNISIKVFLKRIVFVLPLMFFLLILNAPKFAVVSLKVFTSVLVASVITSNFSVYTVSKVLKKIKTPEYLRDIFILVLKLFSEFVDDVKRIKKSLRLKGSYTRKTLLSASYLGSVVGLFFIRSVARSNNIYRSMKIKGY